MPVFTKYYRGLPGQTMIMDMELAFVSVLKVTRSGLVHRMWDYDALWTPGLVFKYNPWMGAVEFNPANPFEGPLAGRPNGRLLEAITITYKIP